jgi:hypothetical protein
MNDTLISAIQSFTLEARGDLEREAHEQLEGLYGWLGDGSFAAADRYPALALDEAQATRARLEQYARDEAEAGFDAAKARRKLVREAAFTWLNRCVAFKMLESRRVLKTLLAPPERANAYLLWLADEHDPEARSLHDAGDTPVNALGEGPRQTAYRRFLLWQCGELAREMSVLFDPATFASCLCPRPNALRALTEALNAAELADAWTAGNEETIGWVYQAFSAEELQAAFAAARQSKKKFEAEDIPSVTQLFTIRWVVRFLVENTLGRLWMEMHPDSKLKDRLEYLVPPAGEPASRMLKLVREILFLDPSCGSMHFGLVAFDIFVDMYREEIAHAGQPGWPATPSVATEAEIPAAIVEHNIHGIDLDPRAVQISALTLLIKARGLNREATVTDRNLACCNVEAITGGRLDAIVAGAQLGQPVYERILRAMASRLKDSNNLGSLLRPERDLERLIDEERGKLDRSAGMLPGMGESDLFALDTPEERERFFAELATEISARLDAFVQSSRADGKDETHFVGEAAKGLNFLRLVQQRYDVVATNPPYLSGRKMNKRLATLMSDEYPDGKGDLYAAFIQRCAELLDPNGLMGMLTMHSYMFISSYENLRTRLRGQIAIQTMAHFGGGLFAVGNPGTLQTTAFVFEKQPDAKRREANVGVYFRLVKERDADAKRLAFESAVAAHRAGQPHPQVFTYKQSDFDAIPGKPWVYWMPAALRRLFVTCDLLEKTAKPRQGLATADNTRFLRFWWEVGSNALNTASRNLADAIAGGSQWFPYNKGGSPIPWHSKQQNVVNWESDGAEIRNFGIETGKVWSRPQNTGYYFRRGVTWSLIASKGFAARLSPGGSVFDVAGMTCFPPEDLIPVTLAILNSRVAKFILSALNPTINYQVGDIERLPVPMERSSTIADLVNQCVELTRHDSREDETTYEFSAPLRKAEHRATRQEQLHAFEAEIDAEVSRLYGLGEEDMAAIDLELNGAPAAAADEDAESADEDGDGDDSIQALEVSQAELSRRWISYAIGTVLGRFEIGKPGGLGCGNFAEETVSAIRGLIDNGLPAPHASRQAGGIMPCEAGHAQDVAARALACLNLMLGENAARETVRTGLGEGEPEDVLRGWLDRFTGQPAQSFWRYHFQMYRKRPAYWPFQSPKRLYTVWVFHEKLGPDTLFRIRNEFVEPRLRLAERAIADLRVRAAKDRKAGKELDRMLDLADDLTQFAANLKAIADRGYTPQIDDGVLLNAAPLHEVLPSWPDTKAAWKDLSDGKFDWAHQAMAYWPDRVKAACLTNKSFAIAHGLAIPEEPAAEAPKRRGRRKSKAIEEVDL